MSFMLRSTTIRLATASIIVTAALPAMGQQAPQRTLLFQSLENSCFKIPALASDGASNVVAVAEQRLGFKIKKPADAAVSEANQARSLRAPTYKIGCPDWGYTNVVVRRSGDGGRTWSDIRIAGNLEDFKKTPADQVAVGNPTITWVPQTKRFILLVAVATSAYGDNSASCIMSQDRAMERCKAAGPAETHTWQIDSADMGQTWSKPVRVDPPGGMATLSRPGPGHGTVLDDGRIVVPAYPQLLISADQGKSWTLGADNRKGRMSGGETSLADLGGGKVWTLVRASSRVYDELSKSRGAGRWILSGISNDSGRDYASLEGVDRFPIPLVQTALLAMKGPDGQPQIVLSSPYIDTKAEASIHGDRRNLMIALGSGPTGPFIGRIVHPAGAGYSDIAQIGPDRIGVIFEGADRDDPLMKERSYLRNVFFQPVDLSQVRACKSAALVLGCVRF